jgi:hypothetical protein
MALSESRGTRHSTAQHMQGHFITKWRYLSDAGLDTAHHMQGHFIKLLTSDTDGIIKKYQFHRVSVTCSN